MIQDNENNFNLKRARTIKIINKLQKITKNLPPTMSELVIKEYSKDPFIILISCLLSLRSRDIVTWRVAKELFSKAKTPREILDLPIKQLEKILYPIGFYHKKATLLHEVSKDLIKRFNSKVPNSERELLSINGVGRKTANLVLAEAFSIPAICVDTHVHKLSNKLKLVNTKNAYQTEVELQKIVPKNKWIAINHLLVKLGQNFSKLKNEFNDLMHA